MELDPGEILFLSRSDVESVSTPRACFERVEETFRWVSDDEIDQVDPVNLWLPAEEYGLGAVQAFPSHVRPLETAGNKWLSTYLENDRRDLPAFTAVNVLTDAETGMPLAVLEGQSVTARRTAGHAGVGARYLARPESETVAIIGCGDQGTAFLRLVADLFDLAAVRVCNRDEERRQSFVAELSDGVDARFEPTGDPREAVDGADIVCTATTAERPVVQGEWVDPGTHVAAVSGFLDLDPAFSRTADRWVVGWHDRDLTWIDGDEQGRLGPETLSAADVYADVTEIMSGERSGRESPDERTVMTHMGMPALDTAVSHLVFERARERDVGTRLALFEHP